MSLFRRNICANSFENQQILPFNVANKDLILVRMG
ncbi:hypothetical protein Nos7524_3457 [Nostoc sp. PCC 7524]|jgi:predicted choloylglycine hydrolase|nr:hypothetical protein Nos7524_3457 [Nostoc sp. PCC 7524]